MDRMEAAHPLALASGARLVAALVCALIGIVFLVGAGFADIPAVHNAAHDGRHAFAFPCH